MAKKKQHGEIHAKEDLTKKSILDMPISEAVQLESFQTSLKFQYNRIIENRRKRPLPKDGFHYKRDLYDRLQSEGKLNFEFIRDNVEDVFKKKSKLPRELREVVGYIGDEAIRDIVQQEFEETFKKVKPEKSKEKS